MNVLIYPALLPLDTKGNILLMKRNASKKFAPNLIGGIGGRMEKTDTSVEAAMQREFEEETNISYQLLSDIRLKVKLLIVNRDENDYLVYFYTALLKKSENLDLSCTEGELEWYPIVAVAKEDLVETLRLSLPSILSEKLGTTVCLFDERDKSFVIRGEK